MASWQRGQKIAGAGPLVPELSWVYGWGLRVLGNSNSARFLKIPASEVYMIETAWV